MSTTSTRHGTRLRGRPAKINRDQIVAAALDLGLDACTMQGIAEQVGVTTPALYSHVTGLEHVIGLANAELARRMHHFATDASDWRTWYLDFAHHVRDNLGPSASTLLAGNGGPTVAAQAEIAEEGMRKLIDAGLDAAQAGQAMWLVFRVAVTASVNNESGFVRFVNGASELVAAQDRGDLSANQALSESLDGPGPHDTLDFDLKIVLDGIEQLVAEGGPS